MGGGLEGRLYLVLGPTRHAGQVKSQPPKLIGATLQQVTMLLCAETGVTMFWESAHLGASSHQILEEYSAFQRKFKNKTHPLSITGRKADLNFQSAHFLYFPTKRKSI